MSLPSARSECLFVVQYMPIERVHVANLPRRQQGIRASRGGALYSSKWYYRGICAANDEFSNSTNS